MFLNNFNKISMSFKAILPIIFFAVAFAGTDGTIRGTVRDVNGDPLPGVQVYIEALGQGATTDGDGTYIILNIPAGLYELHASMIGYDEYIIKNVEVNIDLTTTINISLNESFLEIESGMRISKTNNVYKYFKKVVWKYH